MPKLKTVSFRGIQVYAVGSALMAIVGGGSFVLLGVDGVPAVIGTEYPSLVPALESAASAIDPSTRATFDTWYRALGWYWFVTGLMLLWITPQIHRNTAWFRFIHVGFMAAAVANAVTIVDTGTNAHSRYGAVVIELIAPTVAMLWQRSVAKSQLGS